MIVGGIYAPELFGLRFTDQPTQSTGPFWSSKIRPATISSVTGTYLSASNGGVPTTEYLEVDYGRVRQVMGLMLDIIRLPFDISIEYDSVSAEDGTHNWVQVTPESGLRYDSMILYDAKATSAFAHSEFYFSDSNANMVHTRYLRIGFTRRDTPWPTATSYGRPYSAVVRNLRTFRTVSDHKHMAGPLFASEIDAQTSLLQLSIKPDLTTHTLTQRFVFPTDAVRGEGTETTADDIVPSMLGFSFLADVVASVSNSDATDSDAQYRWSLWDVTDDQIELERGVSSPAVHTGQCWIDCYFSRALEGATDKMYEIRLTSQHSPSSSAVYTSAPVDAPGFIVPTALTAQRRGKLFVVDGGAGSTGLLQVGDYIQAVDGLSSYRVRSFGQPGSYVSFNGVSGRIEVGYNAALNTAAYSTSFWYRREASTMGSVESVIVDNSNDAEDGWRVSIGPDGGSLTSALSVTCAGVTLYDDIDTADGEWHHAFVTFSGSTLTLYRDGVAVDTMGSLTMTANPDVPLCMGTKWGTDWDNLTYGSGQWTNPSTRYSGNLDELMVFNDDLGATDAAFIAELGHGGSAGPADIAAAYGAGGTSPSFANTIVSIWAFDDPIASAVAEDTYGAFDGTVKISGVSFTGELLDQYVIEVDKGWREPSGTRTFFIVPRLTYVAGGQYVADHKRSLALRMWSDTGDSGRDVLGNKYRYATRQLDSASRVLDPNSPGWMSAPRPSAEAVESLYFDVRQAQATGQNELAVIDNIRVAPRTHGVRMHVYYSRDNLHGEAPTRTEHWDQMLWTPINEIYTLRRDEAIQLPYGVQASFIKLEFTNLRPMPFNMSPFPELPPVEFKRHPTWVENAFQNTQIRRTVEDWFVQGQTLVQRRILKEIADPIQEFAYKQREFMTALSQGLITDPRVLGNGLIDPGTNAFIDPITSSKIRLTSNEMFRGSLVATLRDGSILGKSLRSRPTAAEPLLRELKPLAEKRSPFVSTQGDRVTHSFSEIAETPMWFNRRCRHFYRTDKARFNRKAYYVGIRDVEFRRNDYTVEFDDAIIDDNLYDDFFLDLNSFARNPLTRIEDGQTVYVSYTVGPVVVTDEPVTLHGNIFVEMLEAGGIAAGVKVFSQPGERGQQYDIETDYMMSNIYQADGEVVSQISRSDMTEYIEVDPSSLAGITFRDSGVSSGIGTAIEEGA